jgi:hypothetical protein
VRFRYDSDSNVLRVGERTFPVSSWTKHSMTDDIPDESNFMLMHPDYRMDTRQAIVPLENTWALSVIWGDATYSDNRMQFLSERPPFVEEPVSVEVGVLAPGPTGLWGNPLAFVIAPLFLRLVSCVSRLPSKDWPPPLDSEDEESVEVICDYIELLLMERSL